MVCDFSPLSKQQVSVESSPPDLTKKRKPGRPRKDWIQDSSDLQGSSDCSSTPSLALDVACPVLPLFPGLISVVDYLDLMHWWTVHTAATVGETKLWREDMPPLSFRHPHLCHIILAMAAQHSSRSKPLESQRYTTLAEYHYELAVREATVNLASLSLDNAQSMYASVMLISLYYFAKGPSSGELLVFTKGQKVPWMSLLQGIRFIFETLGHSAIFHGILAIEPDASEERNVSEVTTTPVSTCQHWQQPLSDLLHMIEQSPEKHATYCAQEAEQLVDSYKATYGTENKPINYNGGKIQDVMGWLYRMDPGFIAQLEAENPVPLILLAYFAVLLKSLE
ncbi:hypothetical protein AK830_g11283 [Neonectria ditissima]|uniref:Transcription factor domain-containing protein n=1 Tax=Neonectria ditissima TaxID=78410 RepID=A0A0P7ADF0_9HYPO|nr:hypothetical protein AK830_g11283 [Neonectria ditissima]